MFEYKSQKELYDGLVPALNVKLKYLRRMEQISLKREDIWNYLKENKWKNSVDLTLADMVQDILHIDNRELINFYKKNKETLF